MVCTCGAWAIHVSSAGGFEVRREGLGQGRKRPIVRQRGHGKKVDQVRSTHSLETAERVMGQDMEKRDRERGTHQLETVEGETNQDIERKRSGEGQSQAGNHRGGDKTGHDFNV